jgi:uncharacterized membrane protein YpjA
MTRHREYQIDDTVPYLSYRIINFNITFFWYIKLNIIDYLLVMYNIQSGITIEAKYV